MDKEAQHPEDLGEQGEQALHCRLHAQLSTKFLQLPKALG